MKPLPKFPEVPPLTSLQIEEITKLTFLTSLEFPNDETYDLLFVFGGTHPEIWDTVSRAYHAKSIKQILITGGYNPRTKYHSSWTYGCTPESHIIRQKLIEQEVDPDCIIIEDQSTNSWENVQFAQEAFDFSSINTMLFASKYFSLGRQYRTLKQQLPKPIQYSPLPILSTIKKMPVTPTDWMNHSEHRSIVFGEYLRMVKYGRQGHIFPLEKEIEGLEKCI